MSFDLIKKQKEILQKEKRRVTRGVDFCRHPLAYQPVAKGKSKALKEQIINTKGKFDSIALENVKKSDQKTEVKMERDKNATALFVSNMQAFSPGKKGKHIGDVFYPNNDLPFTKTRKKSEIIDFSPQKESYLGYNEKEAHLSIKLNQKEDPRNDFSGLSKSLMDEEFELPDYDPAEIYGVFNPAGKTEAKKPKPEEESNFWEEFHKEQQRRPVPEENYQRDGRKKYDTFVKLSFKKPEETVSLDVSEELEEEEILLRNEKFVEKQMPEIQNYRNEYQDSEVESIPQAQPETKKETRFENRNVVDLSKIGFSKSGNGKNQVKITVKKQIEDEQVPNDYAPLKNYYFEKNNNFEESKIWEKAQNFSLSLRKKIVKALEPKEENKIVNFEFKNGREYSHDRKRKSELEGFNHQKDLSLNNLEKEIVFSENFQEKSFSEKPKKAIFKKLFNKVLTKKEEAFLKKSMKIAQKPAQKFQQNFFTFKSPSSKRSAAILSIAITIALTVPLGAYVQKVIEAKNKIEEKSERALEKVKNAKDAMAEAKPEEARHNFQTAYQEFISANESLDQVGGVMLALVKVIPGGEKVESGQKLLEAGKHLTMAGQIISEAFGLFLGEESSLRKKLTITDNFSSLKEITTFSPESRNDKAGSLTEAIVLFKEKLERAEEELSKANDFLKDINEKDIPEEKRTEFVTLKNQLPMVLNNMGNFEKYTDFLLNLLGHKEPKTYLFLFENNDEIRATGGFIGTYGIIKINEGNISQLFIDGIYNPDGQLKERIIPPKPIQKMSATWSMHDANWWPDFPKSAEKIAWFYEKTGGPTVDGVIALTPKLMRNLLTITGPIKMEKYGVTIDANNFIELTQYEVEVDYDKKMNRPKQFLADLAPIILEKIFSSPPEKWIQILGGFSDCLKERQILMYFFDFNVQKIVSELGWSGEILDTPKDYFSVVNTNISGLKTDRMIEQKINHSVEIKPDGSIFDTVSISRSHKGGKEKYDWYNGVNSNWIRVYVPKGSQLLSAEGYTREVDSSPVDYEKLGFIKDEMVSSEEEGTTVDPYSGTQIYDDSGKTVFANWSYVSPGETLTIKYTYLLPFKINFDDIKKPADTYSLLLQKQAGDERSKVFSEVKGLENFKIIYNYPNGLQLPSWKIEKDFNEDVFAGVVLTKN